MIKITKAQLQKIHVLINQQGLKDEKANIISNVTEGRTTSSRELTLKEAKLLIEWLCKTDPNNAMKKKVFALAYEIGMIWGDSVEDKKMNAIKIDSFLLAKGTVKKKLNQLSHNEMIKVVNQFQKMKEHNEYTKAGKETKQLLDELKLTSI